MSHVSTYALGLYRGAYYLNILTAMGQYRRPLTKGQSIVIGILWVGFLILFLLYAELTVFSILILFMSSFIVLYPVYRSYQQRKGE